MFGGFTLSYKDLTEEEQQEIINHNFPNENYEITTPPSCLQNAKYRRLEDGTVEVMY